MLCDRIDTVSVRSFVFTSGTPASLSDCVFLDDWITPIVVIWRVDNNRGEQVLSFRMQKWISKQGRRTRPKFTFHAYPVHDEDLCAKWMKANPRKDCAVCRHCLHVLFILSSIDTHFTVVVAKSCTHFVVVKQLRHSEDGWNGARFQTTSIHRWSETSKQPASDFFFALVAIHKFTHEVRRIKVVVVLSSF